jgi:hypothetical protein
LTAITIAPRAWELETVRRLPPHGTVTFVEFPSLEPCIAGPHASLGAIEAVRDGDLLVLRAWGEWGRTMIRHRLQYLPNETRVEIYGPPPESDWLERGARLFKLDLAMLPERPRHGYVGAHAIHARSSAVFG